MFKLPARTGGSSIGECSQIRYRSPVLQQAVDRGRRR